MIKITLNTALALIILSFFILPFRAEAAIVNIAHKAAGGAGANTTATTAAADTTGATLLVVVASGYNQSMASAGIVTDSKGNTWHALINRLNSGLNTAIWYAYDHGGSPLSVGAGETVSLSVNPGVSGQFVGLVFSAWSGTRTDSGVFDTEGGAGVTSATTIQPGSLTPASADSLLITSLITGQTGTASISGNSFAVLDQQTYLSSNNMGSAMGYLIQTVANAVNPTWASNGAAGPLVSGMAVFKAAPVTTKTFVDTLTTTGSNTWVDPNDVSGVQVELWGGGGTGGPATGTASGAGGGAGGQYAIKTSTPVTAGTSYTVSVAAGSTANTTTVVNGNDTTFNSTTVVAKGGAGAVAATGATGAGASGSTANGVGDTVYAGGNGAAGVSSTSSGAAGSGAGSTGTGNNATNGTAGGAKSSNGGAGGNGVTTASTSNPGNNYGGGGSGGLSNSATDRAGGNGAQGLAVLTYSITIPDAAPYLVSTSSATTITSGTSFSPSLPSGWEKDDLLILILSDRNSATNAYSVSGWTKRADVNNTVHTQEWYKIAGAGESNPSVTITGSCAAGCSGGIAAYRNVDVTTPFDITNPATSTSAAATSLKVGAVTTVSANATVISIVGTADDNTLDILANNEVGFTKKMAGADTDINSNQDFALADRPVITPAAVAMVTWTETANGTDAWVYITDALKSRLTPRVSTGAASSIGDTSATLNGTIQGIGGTNPTVRGFAYGTSSSLTTTIATTTDTLSGGFSASSFTFFTFGLSCGTTYYARAYATNSSGTGFGAIQSFVTSSCSSAPSLIKFTNGRIRLLNGKINIL